MNASNPRLQWQPLSLHLRNPFRLSYGVSDTRTAYWLRLQEDQGWGEGTIPPYYPVEPAAMLAVWQQAAGRSDPFPEQPEDIAAWVGPNGPAPARSALDLALWDRLGRIHNRPLYALLGLPAPRPMQTSFTIAIDTPSEMARLAAEKATFPILKIKLGSEDDAARLRAVRAARPEARLFVDANAGWTRQNALELLYMALELGVELVEQPLPRQDIAGLGWLQKHSPVPIVADESLQTLDDMHRLAAAGVQAVNLKLMKLGGISVALQAVRQAQEAGMRIMLGSMIETAIGVTAVAHFAGIADWLDLDAPLLTDNDPFCGLEYRPDGSIRLPDRPGIGVTQSQGS